MGMIWKFTMVLLSTLAALVIIVHSAEEDYEAQFRRELRPTMLDTGTPRPSEQLWRTMEMEPVIHQSTTDKTWLLNSSEEQPRRRRSGRKRKRRPETPSLEDLTPMERYGYPDEPVRPYFDVDSNVDRKEADTPKRRRKKLETRPDSWDTPVEEDRPIRRRGQRRKRPSVETWPEFSEFNQYRPSEHLEIHEHAKAGPLHTNVDDYRHFDRESSQSPYTAVENLRQHLSEGGRINPNIAQPETYVKFTDDHEHEDTIHSNTDFRDNISQIRPQITADKSLSEFSVEEESSVLKQNTEEDTLNMKSKVTDKSRGYFKEEDKSQNNGPIDPLTLKDILKKSNGSSLSEILQQHNLSLADLLHGKENVLSILKPEDSVLQTDLNKNIPTVEISTEDMQASEERSLLNSETKGVVDSSSENAVTTQTPLNIEMENATEVEETTTEKPKTNGDTNGSKRISIRRFPTAMRRKQRIRPMMNTTYKSQLSKDMLALNARKYFNNRRRNSTQEWKDLIPVMKKNISNEYTKRRTEIDTTTATNGIEETTMLQEVENCTKNADTELDQINASESFKDINDIMIRHNKTNSHQEEVNVVESKVNVIDRPIELLTTTTQAINASGLRRQAFNNRLKKKRLKQKNLTTEPPQDDIMMNLFGIPNLVSSSEFIARTDGPKTNLDDVTILEDFLTTETPRKHENRTKDTRYFSPKPPTTPQFVFIPISTEETTKIEIEEIFNDTRTSARLSKILKERNMTLSELVEHRERGSSHVHLADIFHNTSKEPNPPEPFLSKSLIEPISKETYPLRALLDANNHDTTAKATTVDSVTFVTQAEVNIPVIMDFGSNVNENAENMGIMSLFHNITKNETSVDKTALKKDSQGTLYETSITIVNTTDVGHGNDTIRESRVIHVINDNQDDIVSWNEIFSFMRRNYENQTGDLIGNPTSGLIPAKNIRKQSLEEDLDGDGLIVLEDIQHLKDFDSNIASGSTENIDFHTYERAESPTTKETDVFDKIPSQTKSVTVATASIAGLAMVLFLLTYIGYRWQQQRSMARKNSFSAEHVPTPVFENRKGHKNNSSSRSISPMLSSNIYTLNTLDSRNGKDSPDYMWDSLRKPFQ